MPSAAWTSAAPPKLGRLPKSRPARLREGKRRLEEEHDVHCRANEAYEAYRARGVMKDGRRFGKPPTPYQPPATPAGKVNISDPDSRNVKTPRGYMQGYNAQAVCNENQIVVAAEINADSPDFGHLEPMVCAAERELAGAGVAEAPTVVVADAGYWHHDQMDAVAGRGIQVLIPPDAGKRKGARPGWDGGRYAFMRRVLETDLGKQLYGKRQVTIEPVFANTKFNRRHRPLLTPRQIRLPVGMAADHRNPQPAQAPPQPERARNRLREARRGPRRRSAPSRVNASGLCAKPHNASSALRNSHRGKQQPFGAELTAASRELRYSTNTSRADRRVPLSHESGTLQDLRRWCPLARVPAARPNTYWGSASVELRALLFSFPSVTDVDHPGATVEVFERASRTGRESTARRHPGLPSFRT